LLGADAPEVIPVATEDGSILAHPEDTDLVNAESSSFEISSSDGAGNTYAVSFVDLDGDGTIDSQTAHIQFVDGSSISYTETGESLSGLFADTAEIATPQDYQGVSDLSNLSGQDNFINAEFATHSYEVQPGDTLSEIAEANDTSIEHLMELNPEISDPNLIYANSELVIPENDHISNPYEIGNDFGSPPEYYAADPINPADGDYAPVDWASFSDDPVVNDGSDYGNLLAQTDFEGYQTPDSYIDTNDYEFGNDSVSSEFL
jgi:LysM repeat protein